MHLHERLIDSGKYAHRIFTNAAFEGTKLGVVHVYIEGDGHPWILRNFIATDPTPYQPLLLPLVAEDRSPALYLGRPCYFGLSEQDARCNNTAWTFGRYGDAVVESMLIALQQVIAGYRPVVWIGHSGGGALASLLASRYKNTVGLLTVAGNLNVTAWTRYHHYSPLNESLDPAQQPPLSASVKQIHLAGSQDSNVLAAWIKEFSERQPNSEFQLMDASHSCCWDKAITNALSRYPTE